MPSPTVRSVELLEREGWTVDRCERQLTRRIKKDLFGFADLIAVAALGQLASLRSRLGVDEDGRPRQRFGNLAVQVTAGTENLMHRLHKIVAEPRALTWLAASPHNGIEIHCWRALKGEVEPSVRLRVVTKEDFA